MINKILTVAITSLVGFTATNNFKHTPNYSYDYIDYESPVYRLGDYDIKLEEFVTVGGGQIQFFRIQAIIPHNVINVLGEYNNVYIAISNYGYNSAVDLTMFIEFYSNGGDLLAWAFDDMEYIPLSANMLKVLSYTIPDIPYDFNVFDYSMWDNNYSNEIRLTFTIPYTAYTEPFGGWLDELRNTTLFTKRTDGSAGYNNGLEDGYNDGYNDGYDDGYYLGDIDGYNTGFADGYLSTEDGGVWNTAFMAVLAPFGLLEIEIFPGVSLGAIALIPIIFGLIAFIFKLGGKGGD